MKMVGYRKMVAWGVTLGCLTFLCWAGKIDGEHYAYSVIGLAVSFGYANAREHGPGTFEGIVAKMRGRSEPPPS